MIINNNTVEQINVALNDVYAKIDRLNMNKHDDLKDLFKNEIDVLYHEDLVINGLGFIKIVEKAKVNVYINKDVEVFTRSSLI